MAVLGDTEYENLFVGDIVTMNGLLKEGQSVVRGEFVGRESDTSTQFEATSSTIKPEFISLYDVEAPTGEGDKPIVLVVACEANIENVKVDASIDLSSEKFNLAKNNILLKDFK
jgi:hypothetical protein